MLPSGRGKCRLYSENQSGHGVMPAHFLALIAPQLVSSVIASSTEWATPTRQPIAET